jgi:glutamate synthase (NADPH/NADH) small chain
LPGMEKMADIPLKERMKIHRHVMQAQDPEKRIHNFDEVNLGYTRQDAREEAMRCLQCKDAPCMQGCPVHVHIPEFIARITEEDYLGAVDTILKDNRLPAICGRVCPQEDMCESRCVVGKKGLPVAIGNLERFSADMTSIQRGKRSKEVLPEPTGKQVAIIGSGPSALACAGDLVRFGHKVTIYEALHAFGGVLVYGIPEFRLPKEVVRYEVESLINLGVRFEKNVVIGMTITLNELMTEMGYDAVYIAAGAGLPYFIGIPGEDLVGIYSSNELLTRVNLMKAYQPEAITPVLNYKDKNVAVFGAGNTALDSARTARRLGARKVSIIYRRSEAEMPARLEEAQHAREEGIEFIFLAAPLEFLDNGEGWLKGVRLQRMQLGEPDASGRRRPLPLEGSEFTMDIDMAVIAIGNGTNPILRNTPGLEFSRDNTLVVNPQSLQTSRHGVFAGGDIVTGGATVISAMGAGRQAAQSIDTFLKA